MPRVLIDLFTLPITFHKFIVKFSIEEFSDECQRRARVFPTRHISLNVTVLADRLDFLWRKIILNGKMS